MASFSVVVVVTISFRVFKGTLKEEPINDTAFSLANRRHSTLSVGSDFTIRGEM